MLQHTVSVVCFVYNFAVVVVVFGCFKPIDWAFVNWYAETRRLFVLLASYTDVFLAHQIVL